MPALVAAIAIRTRKLGEMREVENATVSVGNGIDGDIAVSRKRGITLLSREQWATVNALLGANLPWHTRRANLLTEGLILPSLIGRTVRIGSAEILIHGETKPCALMDTFHPNLQVALASEMRGGVHGEVIYSGAFSVGSPISLVD